MTNGPVRVHDTTTNIKATKEFTVSIISTRRSKYNASLPVSSI